MQGMCPQPWLSVLWLSATALSEIDQGWWDCLWIVYKIFQTWRGIYLWLGVLLATSVPTQKWKLPGGFSLGLAGEKGQSHQRASLARQPLARGVAPPFISEWWSLKMILKMGKMGIQAKWRMEQDEFRAVERIRVWALPWCFVSCPAL